MKTLTMEGLNLDMDFLELEDLSSEKFKNHILNEVVPTHRLLGTPVDNGDILVIFGNTIVSCTLNVTDDAVVSILHIGGINYKMKELSLEEGVYFDCNINTLVEVESLKENTRMIISADPTFKVTNAYLTSLEHIDKLSLNEDGQVIISSEYDKYIEAVESYSIRLSTAQFKGIDNIVVELNHTLLNHLCISFTSGFFKYDDKISEIAKLIQWDRIDKVLFSEEYVSFHGTDEIYTCKVGSDNTRDKQIFNLVLRYLFDELKRNFEEFGITVNIVWEE